MINRLSFNRNLTHESVGKIHRAIALMFLVTLFSCTITDSNSANSEANTPIGEVANKLNSKFMGKTVTVSGEIEEVISPKVFIVEGDRLFNDPELLVVNLSGSPIVNDSNIQVTGTVRQFFASDIESEFEVNLAQEIEVEFEGKPVLIATAAVLTPQPGEIAEEPNPFIGKPVTISGKVAQVISCNAFTLDDEEFIGGKELLVVGAMAEISSIDAGETVRVIGLVRKFMSAEIEKDFDVNLQPELKVEYEGKAVAIAQSLQIVE